MKEVFEKINEMDLEDIKTFFDTMECAEAYEKNGIEGVYKETLVEKSKAKRKAKKEDGKEFDETRFEVAYIHSKIEHVTNLLRWKPIMDSVEERKVIADELRNLAEELESIK